jgi:pilus assembly protein Flp/PilA
MGQFSPTTFHLHLTMSSIRRFLRDESAIAVTEYGLLIALIAVLLIGVVTIFGSNIASWFSNKTNNITSF